MRYLALLRGINVSGKNIIKMEDFRKLLEDNSFYNIKTYIQSGNVFFESNHSLNFSDKISTIIRDNYGYEVDVFMVSKADLEYVVQNNPFFEKNLETKQLYVAFLSELPIQENYNTLKNVDFNDDELQLIKNFLFIKYANGAANTKLDNKIIEKKLKVISTMRNWNTVNKLLENFN